MPRPPFFIGVVAGVGFAVCYTIGVLASHVVRRRRLLTEPSSKKKQQAWLVLAGVTPLFIIAATSLAHYWHNEQLALLELPPISGLSATRIAFAALVVFIILLLIQRSVRWVYRCIRAWVAKLTFLPPYAGTAAAAIIATVIVVGTLTGVLQRTAIVTIDATFSFNNNYIDPLFPQPASNLRSGSPDSKANWEGLGREGRRFVSAGPDAAAITEFTGKPAKEPIRIFTGLNNADDRQTQVELAVEELERTGAFDRKLLMVALPTGSGWVEPETAAAFEYMHNGDTAIVTSQYSFLPSGLSLIIDRGDAVAMGKELLHAVESKLRTLPEESRPKLVLYGLSLGSFGGQADFTSEADFASRLDAALFVGTPGFSEPWRTLVRGRDKGSPEVEPVYNGSKVIKFATDSEGIVNDFDSEYKILYFYHATDPFVWFNGSLLYREPDWMREAPGRAVSSHLRWFPVITFMQIAVDQMFSYVSSTNGHDYHDNTVAAMAAATKPENWSADRSRALQEHITPAVSDNE